MLKTARRDESEAAAGHINQVIAQFYRHFTEFCPVDSWSPPVNLYQLERRLELCMDLAGIAPRNVEVRVEPGKLVIRGFRASPEPPRHNHEGMRILSMEIDHGPFARVITLPDQVDLGKIKTEYKDGMLWVHMPLREQG